MLLLLVACSKDKSTAEVKEMTNQEALHYLEQSTYLLVEASIQDTDGSFEQKSSLEAASYRSENMITEIEKGFQQTALTEKILAVADTAILGTEAGLDGNYELMRQYLSDVQDEIDEISDTYLDGELPQAMSYLKRVEGKLNE